MESNEYILGTDDEELRRLLEQHLVWQSAQHTLLEAARVERGARVIDLGCGPGYTSFELAAHVGAEGSVLAVDQSDRFVSSLAEEAHRRSLDNVEGRAASVEELDVPVGSIDAVYSRWLFSWLPDPASVLARTSAWLRPGGAFLLQEYLDWEAVSSIPREDDFQAVVAACMESWRQGGGTIDVARLLPRFAEQLGLVVELFEPMVRIAVPGSPEWRWIGGFFESYLPRLVERGLLAPELFERHGERWRERTARAEGACLTPVLANLVLRKPTDQP